MTELTMGQRIAERRRQLGLSQEALGEKAGVSRQAISKWEADGAVPEVDKLISLSRLFGVSVGWLLGVEDAPEPAAQTEPQVSEELLQKIQQIVAQYQPEKEPLSLKKKIGIGAIVLVAICGILAVWPKYRAEREMLAYTYGQVGNINEQNATIQKQLQALENRIHNLSVVPDAAVSEEILIDHSITTALVPEEAKARVTLSAIPATWQEGVTATLSVRKDGALVTSQRCAWDGNAYTAVVLLELKNGYDYFLVLEHPDGTKQQTFLSFHSAYNLASTYSIGCDVVQGTAEFDTHAGQLKLKNYEISIDNPTIEEPEIHPWVRADLELVHLRGMERTVVDTYHLLKPEQLKDLTGTDESGVRSWSEMTCYPNGPLQLPEMEDGDGLELWVKLEMEGVIPNHILITSWAYINGEFIGSVPAEP